MFFCPFCGTLLLLEPGMPSNQLACSTCAFAVPISSVTTGAAVSATGVPMLTITHSFLRSNRDYSDDEGDAGPSTTTGDAAAANAGEAAMADPNAGAEGGQIITVPCQNEEIGCDSQKALYIQIQMRSADEPPSTFFKCVKCGHQWRQD